MKKCPRCKVVFKDDGQFKCLYCDGSLMNAKDLDAAEQGQDAFGLAKAKELRFDDKITHQRQDYLMGVFFRGSTFLSSFRFNLMELKKGRGAKRFLISTLDLSSIIKIPWVLVNLIYSTFYYFSPKIFCLKCRYHYIPHHGEIEHNAQECSYNQEYDMIQDEVFSGKVFVDLDGVQRISEQKIKAGRRSALYDLLHRNLSWEKALDVAVILVSMIIYFYLFTILVMPIFNEIYHFDAV